ncbi:MAG: aminoacyl-tRNA hydrolase [Candidatus Omnitrophica bacterium]|nr:aminoacyl-tRNA hydrolase [Candidatus Omnitrophota bacterium]
MAERLCDKVMIGLGNPGRTYAGTRHNVGFLVIAALARRHDIAVTRKAHKSLVGSGLICGTRVVLALPQTYMNASGVAVRQLFAHYGVTQDGVLVICDDLNLPQGTIRLRGQGSDGGHKGLRSIIEETGSEEFARLRVGIDCPPAEKAAEEYVLEPFSGEEKKIMADVVVTAVRACESWLEHGIDVTMSAFNHPRMEVGE